LNGLAGKAVTDVDVVAEPFIEELIETFSPDVAVVDNKDTLLDSFDLRPLLDLLESLSLESSSMYFTKRLRRSSSDFVYFNKRDF